MEEEAVNSSKDKVDGEEEEEEEEMVEEETSTQVKEICSNSG